MTKSQQNKYCVFEDNKIKFNIHTNFCGRKECKHFKACGQALSDIGKHKLISKGLIPQIDTHGNITCFKKKGEPDPKPGPLNMDNTPDLPARMMDDDEQN